MQDCLLQGSPHWCWPSKHHCSMSLAQAKSRSMQEVHAQDASPVVPAHGVTYVPNAAVALATLLTRTFTSSLQKLRCMVKSWFNDAFKP